MAEETIRAEKTFDGIGIDTQFNAPPFLGVIVADTLIEGKYGKQWFYAVRPVNFTIPGIAFKDWVNPSNAPGQKLDIILRSLRAAVREDDVKAGAGAQLGDGTLIGTVAYFQKQYHPLFDGKTRTVVPKSVLVGYGPASDEEVTAALAMEPVSQAAVLGTVGSNSNGVNAPADPVDAQPFELTPERRAALETIYAETNSIARLKLASANLRSTDPELLSKVVSGEAEELLATANA